MEYDLNEFNNTVWENFFGSKVEYKSRIQNGAHSQEHTAENLGTIQLLDSDGDFYKAWTQSFREVHEINGGKLTKDIKICRPPNILAFQIQRVKYQLNDQKKVNSVFKFDQEIYLDLFLNLKKQETDEHWKRYEQKQAELAELERQLAMY